MGSLARSYARMLSVPVPQPDDSLVSLLRGAHVSQFVPKNKTIIVDESLTKEDEQGKEVPSIFSPCCMIKSFSYVF